MVAGLLAIFLGGLGIHKFYLGYTGAGIIMLLCSLFGAILLFIPTFVIGIVALVEGIIYLTKSDQEFYETYEVGKKAWF
ncbi:TM2 domain-containing protein [Rhodobacter sp. 140A]|nr:TM2 domain-containing protein [Rhodobacter sp. 140A]